MWQSWNMKERIWRAVFLVSALVVIVVVNTWLEMEGERQREQKLSVLIDGVRHVADEGGDPATWRELAARGDHAYYDELLSLGAEYIPQLLQTIEREDGFVGYVLCMAVTEIGKLNIPPQSWNTPAEWRTLWNEQVRQAQQVTGQLLSDSRATASERAERIAALGVPAVPHLLEHIPSDRHSEVAVTALHMLLSDIADVPAGEDRARWKQWAARHQGQYDGLTYIFD